MQQQMERRLKRRANPNQAGRMDRFKLMAKTPKFWMASEAPDMAVRLFVVMLRPITALRMVLPMRMSVSR